MTTTRRWSGTVAALGVALSGALTVVGSPLGAASDGGAAYAATAPAACTVVDINVKKGRLEGAAGSRFQTVRAINEGDHACAIPGWTRYRFSNAHGLLGFGSARNPGYDPEKAPIVIRRGHTARSVLSWVDPGVVPRHKCRPRHARHVNVKLIGLPGHYVLPLDAMVCTTHKYRPHGTRLKTG